MRDPQSIQWSVPQVPLLLHRTRPRTQKRSPPPYPKSKLLTCVAWTCPNEAMVVGQGRT